MPHRKLKTGDQVQDKGGKRGIVNEVGWDTETGHQLYVTVHWDRDEPGIVGPAKADDLVLENE
jgi:hypothetical protein